MKEFLSTFLGISIVVSMLAGVSAECESYDKEQMLNVTEPIEWDFTIPEVVYETDYDFNVGMIETAAEIHDLDKDLLRAIWAVETGRGTSKAFLEYHNYAGLTGSNGLIYYDSFPDGLEAFCKTIEWYVDNGMDTPEKMAKVYCPPNADNWARLVKEIMKE